MLARAVNLIAGLGGRLGQITFLLRTDWTTEENNVRGRISDSVWSQRPCHSWSIRKLLYYTKRPAVKLLSKCYKCAGMAFRASLFHIQRYQTVGAVVELSQANSWKNLHHWLGTGVWGCTIESYLFIIVFNIVKMNGMDLICMSTASLYHVYSIHTVNGPQISLKSTVFFFKAQTNWHHFCSQHFL